MKFSNLRKEYQESLLSMESILRNLFQMPVLWHEEDDEVSLIVSAQWFFEQGRKPSPDGGGRTKNGTNYWWLVRATTRDFEIYSDFSLYGKHYNNQLRKEFYVEESNSDDVVQCFLQFFRVSPLSLLVQAEELHRE